MFTKIDKYEFSNRTVWRIEVFKTKAITYEHIIALLCGGYGNNKNNFSFPYARGEIHYNWLVFGIKKEDPLTDTPAWKKPFASPKNFLRSTINGRPPTKEELKLSRTVEIEVDLDDIPF